jgi:hypothetical protein
LEVNDEEGDNFSFREESEGGQPTTVIVTNPIAKAANVGAMVAKRNLSIKVETEEEEEEDEEGHQAFEGVPLESARDEEHPYGEEEEDNDEDEDEEEEEIEDEEEEDEEE